MFPDSLICALLFVYYQKDSHSRSPLRKCSQNSTRCNVKFLSYALQITKLLYIRKYLSLAIKFRGIATLFRSLVGNFQVGMFCFYRQRTNRLKRNYIRLHAQNKNKSFHFKINFILLYIKSFIHSLWSPFYNHISFFNRFVDFRGQIS